MQENKSGCSISEHSVLCHMARMLTSSQLSPGLANIMIFSKISKISWYFLYFQKNENFE